MSIRAPLLFALLATHAFVMPASVAAQVTASAGRSTTVSSDARVALGEKLFTDTRLSADRRVSCSTCHIPEKAFSDGLSVAIGVFDQKGNRNTPSLWNVATLPNQFWDGRRSTLEEQALDPFTNPREHGLPDESAVLSVIRGDAQYQADFLSAFGVSPHDITMKHAAAAIAAFERTLTSNDSAFDRYFTGKEPHSLSDSVKRGLDLFRVRAECASCHSLTESDTSFTDHQFHSLGVAAGSIEAKLAELTQRVVGLNRSELDHLITADREVAALGRFVVTKDPRDIGTFRTPSLRNVALTAPYMHDGSVPTLETAIESEIYYRSLQRGRPLILTPSEKADLVAFLQSLTSPTARKTLSSKAKP